MNSFKMAYNLLKNNLKTYGFYIVVLIVTISTYYNFTAIQYNDTFNKMTNISVYAQSASIICSFVLLLTVIFFMFHANDFFFKQRQKETGLYMLMGITTSKIGKVFAIESIFLGGIALITGLPLGIALSKLFFMLLGKAMLLDTQIPFEMPVEAIVHIFIVFSVIFIVLGIKNYTLVKKSQLINMINSSKMNQGIPKQNYLKGVLGIILILGGYILALNAAKARMDLILTSWLVLILVCIGTYFFFGSFLSILLKNILKKKGILYKNTNLISVNNTFFRLKGNYKNLAMTAILAASTVTAFETSLSVKQFCDENVIRQAPYSFNYINKDESIDRKIIDIIEESKHEITGINESKFIVAKKDKHDVIVISYSELKNTLEFLNYKDKDRILKDIKPEEDETVYIRHAGLLASTLSSMGENIRIDGNKYIIKVETKLPFIGLNTTYSGHSIYLVSDTQYDKLKKDHDEIMLKGIQFTNEKDSLELVIKIIESIPEIVEDSNSYVVWYSCRYYIMGAFYFLGIIMSIVFMLATFSTLYFKILSDALMDRDQYVILKKVGMSKKEVQKSVNMQVAIGFLMPTILGIIHSVIAMQVIEAFLSGNFMCSMVTSVAVFVTFMIIFYLRICRSYTNMVYGEQY